uniref:EF-hand domain-containing protein n=1 Tax=Percolomonas cosmopolitus TaxID=63605 RepID=A0A7S1KPK5_9EUKA|mmetsp:Transcript_1809/g.6400  ORF Transcript_1809/g.6400 Transcript_1809/m.6400 type:complete len:789 (+) Transcript_1809:157-2523(+)
MTSTTSNNPFLSPISKNSSKYSRKSPKKHLSKFYLHWLNDLFAFTYESYSQLNDCIAYHVFFDFITRRGTPLHTIGFPERLEDLYAWGEVKAETNRDQAHDERPSIKDEQEDKLHVEKHSAEEAMRPKPNGIEKSVLEDSETSFNISVQAATPLPEEGEEISFAEINAQRKRKAGGQNGVSISMSVEGENTDSSTSGNSTNTTTFKVYPRIISMTQCQENALQLNAIVKNHHILLSSTVKEKQILENISKQEEQIHYVFLKFCHTYWKRYYKDLKIDDYRPRERIHEAWNISEENRKAYIEEERKFGRRKTVSDEEHFRKAFRMIDLNGNGELDLDEIQEFALSSNNGEDNQFNTPESVEALKVLMREAKGDAEFLTESRFVQYMKEQKQQQEEAERMEHLKKEARDLARIKTKKRQNRVARHQPKPNQPKQQNQPSQFVVSEEHDLHPMILHEEDFSFLRQVRLKSMIKERKKKSKHDQRLRRLTNLATPPNYSKYAEEHEIRYSFRPSIISEVPQTSRAPPKQNNIQEDASSHHEKPRKRRKKRNKKYRRTPPQEGNRLPSFSSPTLKGKSGGEKRRSTYEHEHRLRQGESIIAAALRESKVLNKNRKKASTAHRQDRYSFLEHPLSSPVHVRRRNSTKHVVKCKACGQHLEYHKRHNHLCDLSEMMQHRHRHSQPTTLSHYDPNNYIHRLWKRAAEERERFELDRELNGLAADDETEKLLQNYYNFPTIQKASLELEYPTRRKSSVSPIASNAARTSPSKGKKSPKEVSPYEAPLITNKAKVSLG